MTFALMVIFAQGSGVTSQTIFYNDLETAETVFCQINREYTQVKAVRLYPEPQ